MPVSWTDALRAIRTRSWTIDEAWSLVESSAAELGSHPDVHVLLPESPAAPDKHFIYKRDFKGVEYRDRGAHSLFRNAWEAAGAVCVALNSDAGLAALTSLPAGKTIIRFRTAAKVAPKQTERLQIAYQGAITGVSYFEKNCEFVFLLLEYKGGNLGLKTAYPVASGKDAPPPGKDAVRQGALLTLFNIAS